MSIKIITMAVLLATASSGARALAAGTTPAAVGAHTWTRPVRAVARVIQRVVQADGLKRGVARVVLIGGGLGSMVSALVLSNTGQMSARVAAPMLTGGLNAIVLGFAPKATFVASVKLGLAANLVSTVGMATVEPLGAVSPALAAAPIALALGGTLLNSLATLGATDLPITRAR